MPISLESLRLTSIPRRLQSVIAIAAILFCLIGLTLVQFGGRDLPASGAGASAARAAWRTLPARPEDIERHGGASRSMLDREQARSRNAAVPYAQGPLVEARAFQFAGSGDDFARALACLSTAVLYEAGDDASGQAAVAQVVLNRVRHPAFPGTVCGVVYQGAERSTGCQFTFTCDGSLRRTYADATWQRAREVAGRALSGVVDRSVSLATHYHTDWVYPYWSPKLRKYARVGTHLFFGWPGTWGERPAFARRYRGGEPAGLSLAVLKDPMAPASDAAMDDLPGGEDSALPGIGGFEYRPAQLPARLAGTPLYGSRVRLVRPDGKAFGLLAGADSTASKLVNAALALCGEPGFCQVQAWSHEDDIPGAYPIPQGTRDTMVFEYIRSGEGASSAVRFDCERYPNKDPNRCLRPVPDGPAGLSGVHRKGG